jgi:hypothetical protein
MRLRVRTWLTVLVFGVLCVTVSQHVGAAAAPDFFGTWTGNWDGGSGGGGFDLVLEKNKDGAAGGTVSVTGEPTYKATLKTVTFEGQKLTAVYDFPPDDRAEVLIAGTFDGDTGKGTWTVRGKNGGDAAFTGGWSVKRK